MSIKIFRNGQRLYVTPDESEMLLPVCAQLPPLERTLCEILIYTGCRISEALALTRNSIDLAAKQVTIQSLKKRKPGIFRTVPLSPEFLSLLAEVHHLEAETGGNERLWSWHRTKGWMVVKSAFAKAHIEGPWATPKGLRHGFAILAIDRGVPLPMIQKWMGHSSLNTTAIYMQAIGKEERAIASRMWASRHSSIFSTFLRWIGSSQGP